MTRRPLRAVPSPALYRPGRRVSPKRTPGTWTLRPDSLSEALRAWLWTRRILYCLFGWLGPRGVK